MSSISASGHSGLSGSKGAREKLAGELVPSDSVFWYNTSLNQVVDSLILNWYVKTPPMLSYSSITEVKALVFTSQNSPKLPKPKFSSAQPPSRGSSVWS